MKKATSLALLALALSLAVPVANAGEAKASALLKTSGISGGICLVIGGDAKLAAELASSSKLYVRLHTRDEERALAAGAQFAAGELRNRIGVSSHRLDPMPYISNLLNLIVVGDVAGLKPKELVRVLAPGGVLAVKGSLKTDLKKFGSAAGFDLYRKPAYGPDQDWGGSAGNSSLGNSAQKSRLKPSANIRWRAEPRHHRMSNNYETMICAGGRTFYKELMEVPGGGAYKKQSTHRWGLFARDAFNGRELWQHEGEPFRGNPGTRQGRERSLAADRERLFAVLKTGLVCCDAATGKKLFDVEAPAAARTSLLLHGKVLLVQGKKGLTACSAETGKKLWAGKSDRLPPVVANTAYAASGNKLSALNLASGASKWSAQISAAGSAGAKVRISNVFCTEKGVHVLRSKADGPAWINSFNMADGKKIWSHHLKGPKAFYPQQAAKYKHSSSRRHEVVAFPDMVCLTFRKQNRMPGETKGSSLHVTAYDAVSGKVIHDNATASVNTNTIRCYNPRGAGKYILYGSNIYVDRATLKSVDADVVRSTCFYGLSPANGYVYALPFHKGGKVKGLVCAGVSDLPTITAAGGKVLKAFGAPPTATPLAESDWGMYRKDPTRSNFTKTSLGAKPAIKWQTQVGKGGRSFAVMASRRTGLTQPTAAWGMVFVSDIEGQRIVALDQQSGEIKWTFSVGSRVLFSPTLYAGMCFVGACDGWVYALNAGNGKLIWKLMIAPEERFIGGMDKLESLWPVQPDVFIHKGVGYALAGHTQYNDGGLSLVGFTPATGKVLWRQNSYAKPSCRVKGGLEADIFTALKGSIHISNYRVDPASGALKKSGGSYAGSVQCHAHFMRLLGSNNIFFNARSHGAGMTDGRTHGAVLSFGKEISVAQFVKRKSGYYEGDQFFYARKISDNRAKKPYDTKGDLWRIDPYDMNIDGMLMTGERIFAVGHFAREKRDSELRVISRSDGKTLHTVKLKDWAAYDGMSAADGKLFISTRAGKLICFEGK
jgi:outer membrane protein assembly factor BamB